MILVDSSVWIAHFRREQTIETAKLKLAVQRNQLLVGDLVLLELLQGSRDDLHAARIRRELQPYSKAALLDEQLAVRAAENYRMLRRLGVTLRKTTDLIIGTYCIEHHHTLLHADRDFRPMQDHLGLHVL